jgi:hypothetical protein
VGLNIYVMRSDHRGDHPRWDWLRYAGDREFATLASTLPRVTKGPDGWGDDWVFVRPASFEVWRKAVGNSELPNPDRYFELLDVLEREPDYWIYFSY